jgi:PAS domain S-box-containing protein
MDVRQKRAPKPRPRKRVPSTTATCNSDLAQQILEAVPGGVIEVSLTGAISFANSAAVNFLGLSYDDLSKLHINDFRKRMIYENGARCPVIDYPVSKCLATGQPQPPATLGVRRPDGAIYWGIFTALPAHDKAGRLFGAVVTFIDITNRHHAEDALRESEERYRQLVELCPDGLLIHTNGILLFANKALAEILGAGSPDELVGQAVMDIVHPDSRDAVLRRMRELQAGVSAQPWMEQKLVRKDGTAVEIEAAARPFTLKGHPAIQVLVRDITSRKRAEHERDQLFQQVENSRARLEELSRRLVDVQEAERRRIARELHDHVGQELTALKLNLDRLSAKGPAPSIDEAQSRVNHLVNLVRQMSLDLRPIMLDDLGLLAALHWHFDRYFAMSGVRVNFKHSGVTDRRFPPEVETAAYRVVQEALTNVVRHSRAQEVIVRLWTADNTLSVQVEDLGVGFDRDAAISACVSSGLSGMRERAALLGGRLSIESTLGSGTHLTAEFPINDKNIGTDEQNSHPAG